LTERKIQLGGVDTVQLLGFNDANLQVIEDRFASTITVRGDQVTIRGSESEVSKIEKIFKELIYILNKNGNLTPNDVETVIDLVSVNGSSTDAAGETVLEDADSTILFTKVGVIKARTPGQKQYFQHVRKNDIVFAIGPAGTGKTYLAVAFAVAALKNRDVTRIILARPAVEAGEKLGFLPGDLQEKVNPYLRPLYDALYDLLEGDRVERLLERGTIEIAPLAFMRGRTLNDSFVILDEAQNTTPEQMKMFLTRLGFGSKAVITGDITQIDLPAGRTSGLIEAMKVVGHVEGISFIYFDERDVVRNKLVQLIVKAYENYTNSNGTGGRHGS
jgi:phosphate starvation-inducible PhoH-like protein